MNGRLSLYCKDPELHSEATLLAQHLQIPLTLTPESSADYSLILSQAHLALHKQNSGLNPFSIDFLSPELQYRGRHASLKKEALAKALGLKNNTQPLIIDGTGGLGIDSFIIGRLGFNVTLLERSPLIHALLKEGLLRGMREPLHASYLKRLTLIHADAISYFKEIEETQRPDIIYLDPMFSPRKKGALNKKEMIIFHDIIGDDTDATQLLSAALACAKRRIVVKRARHAETLTNLRKPSYSLLGRSNRFDIYLI